MKLPIKIKRKWVGFHLPQSVKFSAMSLSHPSKYRSGPGQTLGLFGTGQDAIGSRSRVRLNRASHEVPFPKRLEIVRKGVTLSAEQSDLLEKVARPSGGAVSSKMARMAEPKLEFMFDGDMAGIFEGREYPRLDGRCLYVPYRGVGHYRMQEALRLSGSARCYYDVDDSRVFFDVSPTPGPRILGLSRFTRTDRPAT